MLARYVGSLLLALALVCGVLSSLPFVARSQVRAGVETRETWAVDFTLRAPDNHYYPIDDELKSALEQRLTFRGSGPVQVRSVDVRITPKQISWTRNKTNYNAPGAQILASVAWLTPADARDGDRGDVHIFFPKLPNIPAYTFIFHSGAYQKSPQGHWAFRDVTVWRTDVGVALGRLRFALIATLPIALLLHTIAWGILLPREKRRRIEALAPPPGAPEFPRLFHPSPTAQWAGWLLTICIFSGMGVLPALIAISQGYQSASMRQFILITQVIGLILGLAVVLLIRATAVTVRLDTDTLSYARGPRANPRWTTIRWADLRGATVKSKSYRGQTSVWIELTWPDGSKRRIPSTVTNLPLLRDSVSELFVRHERSKSG